MARTIQQIYDEMVAEKQSMSNLNLLQPNIDNSQNLLNDLTSSSKVAIWRLIFFVIAVSIWSLEKLFDQQKTEIEERAAELVTGTTLWYRDQALIFQNGDTLTWDGNKYSYPSINESAKIIKRAAVIEAGGQVRIKVAKLTSGLPVPLSLSEKTSFEAYINKIKFAGTNVDIISLSSDLLKISYKIVYDPLVLNLNGELISNTTIKPIELAITNHIQNLPFNGVLNLTKLTDEVQKASGVIDAIINSAEAKYGSIPYQPIIENYNAVSGHMSVDSFYPLSTLINYVPYV